MTQIQVGGKNSQNSSCCYILPKHDCNTLQHTATHCNTLQHTATHCNALQHTTHLAARFYQNMTATHCNTLQHTATHCNALQHTTRLAARFYHMMTIQLSLEKFEQADREIVKTYLPARFYHFLWRNLNRRIKSPKT